jgi:dephospho-CoA kinase
MADNIKIIGISGTNGSGKDSLGQLLAKHHGWFFISVTDILRDELRHRNEPIERENLRRLSADWHKKYGAGVLSDMAVKEYEKVKGQYKGLVFSSIRRPGEADRVHELGGKVVWMDADPKVRYERISGRGRSAEDKKSFKEFLADEHTEMFGGHGHTLNMSQVKERADIFIQNNSNNIKKFQAVAEKALKDFI